ncbi:MAG: hypothetical protein J6J36_01510 [Clostridia bacterium]|nr:hypothetical protein [Clostridia bacterium]
MWGIIILALIVVPIVVVCRGVNGATRGLYSFFMQVLRDYAPGSKKSVRMLASAILSVVSVIVLILVIGAIVNGIGL